MVAKWLRLHASDAGGTRSTPGQGTRSHMLQLKEKKRISVCMNECICYRICNIWMPLPHLQPFSGACSMKGRACWDMPRKNATDKFRRLAKLPGTDPLQPGPSRYRHGALGHQSPLPYMGRPGLDASPGYKTSPHPSYLADSLCLLAHPSPGVLPESDRPIKAFINGP